MLQEAENAFRVISLAEIKEQLRDYTPMHLSYILKLSWYNYPTKAGVFLVQTLSAQFSGFEIEYSLGIVSGLYSTVYIHVHTGFLH